MWPLEVRWDIKEVWELNFLLQKLQVSSVEGGGGDGWDDTGGCWTVIGDDITWLWCDLGTVSIVLGSTSSVIGLRLNWDVIFGLVPPLLAEFCFFLIWMVALVLGVGAAGTGIIGMWEVWFLSLSWEVVCNFQ